MTDQPIGTRIRALMAHAGLSVADVCEREPAILRPWLELQLIKLAPGGGPLEVGRRVRKLAEVLGATVEQVAGIADHEKTHPMRAYNTQPAILKRKRAAAKPETRVCKREGCTVTWETHKGSTRQYCGDKCREAAREARRTSQHKPAASPMVTRLCAREGCGKTFTCKTTVKTMIYCSRSCNGKAYRARRGATHNYQRPSRAKLPVATVCQREGCGAALPEGRRATQRYCCERCSDAVRGRKRREQAKREAKL